MLVPAETAAAIAGVQPPTIRQWAHRGHLRSYPRWTTTPAGRLVRKAFFDPREVLLAERATRRRGADR